MAAATEHFRSASWEGKEAMGLLVGRVFVFEGRPYAVVDEYVTAANDATAVHVRFAPEAFSELSKKLMGGRRVVGWAHSHPDYGCFLSTTDVATQETYFQEPYHVALVVDPVRNEKQCFKANKGQYAPVSYAVIRKKS